MALLLLHGTGGDEHDLLPLGKLLVPDAHVLSPRGQVLEHGMPRFFRRFAEGVLDLHDLEARAHDLAKFITAAKNKYELGTRLFAVGYSNGANMASALLFLHPDLFSGAVLFRGMVALKPMNAVSLQGRQILLLAGINDPTMPQSDPEKLEALFNAYGAQTYLHWTSSGHQLSDEDIRVAQEWFKQRKSLDEEL